MRWWQPAWSWCRQMRLSLVAVPVKAHPASVSGGGDTIAEFIAPTALDPVYASGKSYYLFPDGPAPPRPPVPLVLEQLWSRLTDEQRQQTLTTLSVVVVRQLGAARDEREVRTARDGKNMIERQEPLDGSAPKSRWIITP